jgi:hydroxypyruvate reductase
MTGRSPADERSEPGDDLLHALRTDVQAIVRAGLEAVHPGVLVEGALERAAGWGSDDVVKIIAVGKAAPVMAVAALPRLGPHVAGGLVVGAGPFEAPRQLETIVGGHPVPNADSERAGRRVIALATKAAPEEHVVVLLSGGASALMAVPAPGVSLDDKRRTTDLLLRSGADIRALNTVRKHISGIKGGQLACASQASFHTFAISDVVGDDLGLIGSGPTVPDASSFQEALDVIERFGGIGQYPRAVTARLVAGAAGSVEETPKPGDPRFRRSIATVIGGRHQAMRGAAERARTLGYKVSTLEAPVIGDARAAATRHVTDALASARGRPARLCVISSGETTVHVTGAGQGGRNQEFALAAVDLLASAGRPAVLASVGTDGIDGPTPAAGAIVDTATGRRALQAGILPAAFLEGNDSYSFFRTLGDLIETGATGTNVGDLQVLLLA